MNQWDYDTDTWNWGEEALGSRRFHPWIYGPTWEQTCLVMYHCWGSHGDHCLVPQPAYRLSLTQTYSCFECLEAEEALR